MSTIPISVTEDQFKAHVLPYLSRARAKSETQYFPTLASTDSYKIGAERAKLRDHLKLKRLVSMLSSDFARALDIWRPALTNPFVLLTGYSIRYTVLVSLQQRPAR